MEPSVTDWIQAGSAVASVFVSVVGITLVLRSIQQQREASQAQFDLLRIESRRADRETRPILEVGVQEKEIRRPNATDGKIGTAFYIKCAQGIAYNIVIEAVSLFTHYNEEETLANAERLFPTLPYETSMSQGQVESFSILFFIPTKTRYKVRISFKDAEGVAYNEEYSLSLFGGISRLLAKS